MKNRSLKCLVCKENKDINVSFSKNKKVICYDCVAAMQGIILQNSKLEAIRDSKYFISPQITDLEIGWNKIT